MDDDLDQLAARFAALRDLPPAARERSLEELARTAPRLATTLGDLLDRDGRDDGFLGGPALGQALAPEVLSRAVGGGATGPDEEPVRIGPFTLGEPLAHGGMGVVYEAWQERPHRRVALKLLRAGLTSEGATRRFRLEAEILGRLRHPGIAQVLDSGLYEPPGLGLSLPWFAMEFVEDARPLTHHAQAEGLDLRERLDLFREVCAAVHHGHVRGVVHRDLKPANLLVDGSGRVRVIDFGVARTTDADLGLTSAGTAAGELVGTLQYMSPEQRRGESEGIDARSDVYALGVVLFELLTGERPHALDESSLVAASAALASQAPRSLAAVAPHLHGDLETVVAVALAPDPERRYPSAEALARDITHVLDHEPLDVLPPSALYRLRLFVRRNRALAAGLAVAVLALLGGTAFAVDGLLRARTAEQESRDAALTARQAEGEARDAERRAREAARSADQRRQEAEQAGRRASDAADEAERQRGEAEHQRSLAEAARDETVLRLAEAEAVTEYLTSFLKAGHVMRGGTELTVAQALEQAALLVDEQLADQPRVQLRVREQLGASLSSLGRDQLGLDLLTRALEQQQALGPPDRDRLEILISLASVSLNLGRGAAAADWLDQAQALERSLPPLDDEREQRLQRLELDRIRLHVLRQAGDLRAAAELAPRLIQEMVALGVTGPALTNSLEGFVTVLSNQGRYAEALELNDEVLRRKRAAGPTGQAFLAASLQIQSHLLLRQGRPDQALDVLNEARRSVPAELPDTHPLWVDLDQQAADIHQEQGRFEQAESFCRAAVDREQRSGRPPTNQLTVALHGLSESLRRQGRLAEALEAEQRCVDLLEGLAAPGFYGLAMRRSSLGWLLAVQGQPERGLALMEQALADLLDSLGAGDGRTANAAARLADARQQLEAAPAQPTRP